MIYLIFTHSKSVENLWEKNIYSYFVKPEKSENFWPEFSYVKHKKERKLVVKLYDEDFKAIKAGYAGVIKFIQIPIALVDLNDDGINEVFVGLQHPFYSGYEANNFLLLYKYKKGQLQLITTFGISNLFIKNDDTQTNICIEKGVRDWRDVIVNGEKWVWNGKEYKLLKGN